MKIHKNNIKVIEKSSDKSDRQKDRLKCEYECLAHIEFVRGDRVAMKNTVDKLITFVEENNKAKFDNPENPYRIRMESKLLDEKYNEI